MEIARSSSSTNHDLSVTIFKSEDLEVKSIIDWRKMTGQFVSRLQSLWLLEEWVWQVASILCDLLHEAFAYRHLRPKKTTLAPLKNASNSDKGAYIFLSWEENTRTEEIFNRYVSFTLDFLKSYFKIIDIFQIDVCEFSCMKSILWLYY